LIEYKANPKGQKRWAGKAGYEGYLNHEVGVLPEILEDEGYHTMLAGKVSTRLVTEPIVPSLLSHRSCFEDAQDGCGRYIRGQ
jgi:hypothetical protein